YVATGAAVPEGADSVVTIEDVIRDGEKILFSRSTAPGENVMQTGFDVQRGAMIMRKGERVTSRKAAALSGMGITELEVRRMPRIAVISTGSEIVLPGERYGPVNTYDVNGRYLTSECRRLGCDVDFLGIAADNRKALIEKLDLAKLYDLVLVSAGVSKGVKDLMEKTVSEFGEIILHGINIKPGKPTLASRCGGTLMIGLPGHPTSCVMIFKMLVEPLVHKMCGSEHHFKKRKMKLLKRVVATKGRMQFLPIRVSDDGVVPVFRGSGAITSFLNADGIAIIDENTEYLDPGELLEVVLLDD
ncbi:MAG TPA: molybdopterin molybdotransferase MoeA, partial [Candidatus Methanofastidiosa archaeon]|nr:molybdopterin molybdotransferase MoeA [Candidatus Methanofastidiosa archaeon]